MLRTLLTKCQLLLTAIVILALGLLFGTIARLHTDPNSQPDEIELVTLRPAGFEPSEITRPKGPFVLFVDDRSGKDSSSLELKRLNGQRVRAVSLNRRKSEWNDVVDLSPGTYVLQDASSGTRRMAGTVIRNGMMMTRGKATHNLLSMPIMVGQEMATLRWIRIAKTI